MNITIRESLKNYLHELTEAEFAQLEQNVLADGCLEPLTVWEDGDELVLVDGHNRYEICNKHGVHFDTRDMHFDSELDAKFWIIRNQIGRRNATDFQRTEYALRMKPLLAEEAKLKQATSTGGIEPQLRQNSVKAAPIRTDEVIAKEAGVSRDTVQKVEKILAKGTDEVKKAARTGAKSIRHAAVVAGLPEDQQAAAIAKPLPKKEKPVPAAAPVATPAPETVASDTQPSGEYTELDQLRDQVSELQSELAKATDAKAIADSDMPEEDKVTTAEIIAGLRKDLKQAEIERDAMRQSRDAAMIEVAQLKKQVDIWRRKAEKARP